MKPTIVAGFALLLLLFLPVSTASDESEPFTEFSTHYELLGISLVGQPAQSEHHSFSTGFELLPWTAAAVPDWERQRLLQQIWDGWLQSLPRPDLNRFLTEIRNAHETFLLKTDEQGKVLRDRWGNPVAFDGSDTEADYLKWQQQLESQMERLLQNWEGEIDFARHELLDALRATGLSEPPADPEPILERYRSEVHREFERLYRQAESAFIRLRLRQSEHGEREKNDSPSELARNLITRTQSQIETAEDLEVPVIAATGEQEPSPVTLDPETWKEDFSRAFQRGIEAWERAEQSFLNQRIEWESDARNRFTETEEAWRRAYVEFEQARQSWIEQMQLGLQQGMAEWDRAEDQFLAQHDRVMGDLAVDAVAGLDRLDRELATLLSLYDRNSELVITAKRSIEYLEAEIARLEKEDNPAYAETLDLLRDELAYWKGSDGDGGVLGSSHQALEEAETVLVNLERQIRSLGADTCADNPLEREIARLESELLYLSEQIEAADTDNLPGSVTARQREDFERIFLVLDILRDIEPTVELDPRYLGLKDQQLSLNNTRQIVLLAQESLQQSITQIEDALAVETSALRSSIDSLFDFALDCGSEPCFDGLGLEMLTDFSTVEDSLFAATILEYFEGQSPEKSARLARDASIWLTEMAAMEGGCSQALRRFGLAYYYDFEIRYDPEIEDSPDIYVPILDNPNITVLVEDYLKLGPRQRLVWFSDGKLVQVKNDYPAYRYLPEDYLAEIAKTAYEQIQSEAESNRLYAYFKAMFASGHFVPGADFIRDDLTGLVYAYIEDKARHLQQSWETDWWLFKWWKADEIASLRSKIAPLDASGEEDRNAIASTAAETGRILTHGRDLQLELQFLDGSSEGKDTDAESFVSALSGLVPMDAAQAAALQRIYSRLDPSGRSDNRTALQEIVDSLESDLSQIEEDISEAVSDCFTEQRLGRETYLRRLYDPHTGEAELMEAIVALFATAGLPADSYREAELDYAQRIQPLSLPGRRIRLSEIAGDLYGLMEQRLLLLSDHVQEDLQLQYRGLHDRRIAWETEIGAALSSGLEQWAAGAGQIEDSRDRWLREFIDEYAQKQQMWDDTYTLLQLNRDDWIQNSAENAFTAAAHSIAGQMDMDADRLIGEIQTISLPRMFTADPEPSTVVQAAFPGAALSELLRYALYTGVDPSSSSLDGVICIPIMRISTPASSAATVLTKEIGERIFSHVSLATALQMRVFIEEAEQAIHENITEANRSMEKSLTDLLCGSGYRRSGPEYRRSSVIDKTLFGGIEDENQSVPAYRYFIAPWFDAGVDLSKASLEGRSGEEIQALALRAQENLSRYMQLIFGRPKDQKEGWEWRDIDEKIKAHFQERTAAFQSSEGFHREEAGFADIDGLFPYHIGYEPVMREDAPEEVDEPGYGELGVIMEAFFRNEARQARGLSMLITPWYNLRMWDDDSDNDGEADSWLEAPSARDAVNLAVQIAATATGNVWAAAAVNLADDAIFTIADVSTGYLDPAQALLSFGQQAVWTAATVGTGAGFDALSGAMGAFAEGGVCKALLEGVEIASERIVGATVNAVQLDPDGQLMFNIEEYREALIGRQALRGYLADVSGSTVSSLLAGNLLGFSAAHAVGVQSFSDLAGGLTRAGLEYALTGQTILNLADFSMFGLSANNRTLSGGFIELRIGGESPMLGFGQQGVDVSPTAVYAAVGGYDTWIESMKIRVYDRFGDWAKAADYQGYSSVGTSMRSLYSYGDGLGQRLYQDLLNGETKLLIGFTDRTGQTRRTGDTTQVQLASLGDNRDRYSRLKAGVDLQHEAHRDGLVSDPLTQKYETRRAVAARALMLMSMEQKYTGLIDSDLYNLIDVIMYRADETTFNRYVDELWSSEGDFAERFITRKRIGVRQTQFFDLQKYTPGLAAAFRWAAAELGGDVHTDYLLPESDLDSQSQVIADLHDADAVATQWNMLGALFGTASWAVSGGNLGKSILGINPLDAPDLLGATSALLNDATIARTVYEALGTQNSSEYSSDDVTNVFGGMIRGILEAESLPEMEWYARATAIYADYKIFNMADKAGIPLEVDNRWQGNDRLQAQVANQMMRNYIFLGEMVFNGITDPDLVRKMYYEGFANPVSMGNGLTLWEHIPGFAQKNTGPWDDWSEDASSLRTKNTLLELNLYNLTYYALATNNMDLFENLSADAIRLYDEWIEQNRYYQTNKDIWNDFDCYYIEIYRNLLKN